jgi:hypothetical protein
MTPQYNPDPSQVSAFFYIFSKGDYLFDVGEGKPFEGTNSDGDANAGVRYPLICKNVVGSDGDQQGVSKRQMFTCYIHSEGAISFSKRFLMACLGFTGDDQGETAFNESTQGMDWKIDPDPAAPYMGEMWQKVNSTSLIITADVKLDNDGKRQQQWKAFAPISSL